MGAGNQHQPNGGRAVGAGAAVAPRFTIERPHAQGGLGQVSLAIDGQLKRPVALKEIRPDRRSDEARRRFINEAEITGQLEHPGVVPIYALERDAAGEPYYAMRFIQGRPLSEAIKAYHQEPTALSFREMLQRFVSVCQTLAYAHKQGIIHRDLKPANVMLGEYGETLVVDWGLAKRVDSGQLSVVGGESGADPSCREATVSAPAATTPTPSDGTQSGQALGTPAYMATEQACGDWERVGPAADIFSLGAMLYELLTGRRPLQGKDVYEVIENAKAGCFSPPRQVARDVPRPLEAICLRAMAAMPKERYGTARDLATDIEHWLADEPVAAFAEPFTDRARRWMRRHRVWVSSAVVLLFAAVVALAVGLYFVNAERKKTDEARLAEEARADGERRASESARKRLTQIERGTDILAAIFDDFDIQQIIRQGERLEVVLGRRLGTAARQLRGASVGDPVVVARLQNHLGRSMLGLGQIDEVIPMLEDGSKSQAAELGADNPETLRTLANLGAAYRISGQLDKAVALLGRVGDSQAKILGATHPDALVTRSGLADAYVHTGEFDRAIQLFEEVHQGRERALGADDPHTIRALGNLAAACRFAGQPDRALAMLIKVSEAQEKSLGADHPETLLARANLAVAYRSAGQPEKALPIFEQLRTPFVKRLGMDHPDTLTLLHDLATMYRDAGRHGEALPLFEQVHDASVKKLGPDHLDTLATVNELAGAYRLAGQLEKAIPIYEPTCAVMRKKFGSDHPDVLITLHNLAVAYDDAGQPDRALLLYEEAAAGMEKRQFKHEMAPQLVDDVIDFHERKKQFDRAEVWRRKWLSAMREQAGPETPQYGNALIRLGHNLLRQRKYTEAEPMLREALALLSKLKPGACSGFFVQSLLGEALLGQKKYIESEPLLLQGYTGMKERLEEMPPPLRHENLTEAVERLVKLYDALGKPEEAAKWKKVLAEINEKV